jgi:hypothetical protein
MPIQQADDMRGEDNKQGEYDASTRNRKKLARTYSVPTTEEQNARDEMESIFVGMAVKVKSVDANADAAATLTTRVIERLRTDGVRVEASIMCDGVRLSYARHNTNWTIMVGREEEEYVDYRNCNRDDKIFVAANLILLLRAIDVQLSRLANESAKAEKTIKLLGGLV